MSEADLLVRGGTVIDGTGSAGFTADVAVSGGRIVAVGDLAQTRARTTVDATGRIVCPGFVDVHTHSDLTLLSSPLAKSKVHQGVTTEVVGNCGLGVAPLPAGADVPGIRAAVGYLDLDAGVEWTWRDWRDYADALERARPSVNVAGLVAHLPLRAGVVGFGDRPPSARELDRMCALLSESLDAGAFGLSTGLMYAPLIFTETTELMALGRVVAEHDAVFAWHLRDYSDDGLAAVREALAVAEATGCRTQVSHLTAVGRRNWGSVARALELIDHARSRGADVAVDMYPYLAGNAPLSQRLPGWVQAGGDQQMRERLTDPGVVADVRRSWAADALGWDEVTINSAPDGDGVVGYTVTELAEQRGAEPDMVAVDLLLRFGHAVSMVAGGRGAADLRAVLTHPSSVIGSDGQALDDVGPTAAGMPHPRSYGCYPRLLGDYVGDATLSSAEAIHKSTGAAAERVGLGDRGLITPGLAADIVVFDPTAVADRATFASPRRYPAGIEAVIVNGSITVQHGRHTGARSGRLLTTEQSDKGDRA